MKKLTLLLTTCSLLLHPGQGQAEERAWSSLELDLASLKTHYDQLYTFTVLRPGQEKARILGNVTLDQEVEGQKITLRDHYELVTKRGEITLEMTYTCKKDAFLSPTRIESKGKGDDEFGTWVATIQDGKARMKGNADKTWEVPEGTITTGALMRLVTLVPRKPGSTYTFDHWLEASEMNLKRDYRLKVMEPEIITFGDTAVKCWKMELKGKGISPAYYWVSADAVLQRVLIDGRKQMDLQPRP